MTFDRRRLLGGAGTLLAAELAASSCRKTAEPPLRPGQAAISAGDLAGGRRVTVVIGENPIEVFRDGNRVVARMLRCTHTGCVVRRDPASGGYRCPCHDGRFDENGDVVAGPPPLPLRAVPTVLSGDRVLVG